MFRNKEFINKEYDLYLGGVVNNENFLKELSNYFDEEQLKKITIFHDKRKIEIVSSRYLVLKSLEDIYNLDVSKAIFDKSIFGKPILFNTNINVSLTHTKKYSFFAGFSPKILVGIDLEFINKKKFRAMVFKMTENEKKLFSKNYELTTINWTLKEALCKALGIGLFTSIKIYEVLKIQKYNDIFKSEFIFFPQFSGYSWKYNDHIFSIVLPKSVGIELQVIKKCLETIINK